MLGIAGAVAAALCYGLATVLQARTAQRTAPAAGIDPRLLLRLVRQLPFLTGLALDGAGFLLSLAALRQQPLFVVEAIVAGNLAVAAVAAAQVLRLRLSRREWLAVAAVCAGLVLLALSAGVQSPVRAGATFRLGLLGCAVGLVGVGAAAGRLRGGYSAAVLGLVAGLEFGVVGIAVRVLPDLRPSALVGDPAAYALVVGGLLGFLAYLTALQRGRVTTATGTLVTAETVAPALVGVLALGDSTRPGYAGVGVVGFGLAVVGALLLARFGSLESPGGSAWPASAGPPEQGEVRSAR